MSSILTAADILKRKDGNLTQTAELLGMSLPTLRKHKMEDTLNHIIIMDDRVYVFRNYIVSTPETVHDEWIQIEPSACPLIHKGNADKFKVTMHKGKVKYWKRNI